MQIESINELAGVSELFDELIVKLKRIEALWAQIPSVDALEEIHKQVAAIAGSMNVVREIYNALDFPAADAFDELEEKLGRVAGNLHVIIEQQAEVAE